MKRMRQVTGQVMFYPPASEVSREVASLTERKNPHTPVYGVKEFVCLSVHLWLTLNPIISGLAEQNGQKNLGHLWQKRMSQIFLFVHKVHLYLIDKLAHNTGCYQLPDAAAPKCAQRYSLPSFVIPGCARFSRCRSQQRVEITENYFTKLCLYIMLLISDSYQARNGNGMMFGINGFKPPGINEFNGFKQSGMNEFKSNPMARMPLRSSLSSPVGDLGDYMQIRYFLLLFHCNTCHPPVV